MKKEVKNRIAVALERITMLQKIDALYRIKEELHTLADDVVNKSVQFTYNRFAKYEESRITGHYYQGAMSIDGVIRYLKVILRDNLA